MSPGSREIGSRSVKRHDLNLHNERKKLGIMAVLGKRQVWSMIISIYAVGIGYFLSPIRVNLGFDISLAGVLLFMSLALGIEITSEIKERRRRKREIKRILSQLDSVFAHTELAENPPDWIDYRDNTSLDYLQEAEEVATRAKELNSLSPIQTDNGQIALPDFQEDLENCLANGRCSEIGHIKQAVSATFGLVEILQRPTGIEIPLADGSNEATHVDPLVDDAFMAIEERDSESIIETAQSIQELNSGLIPQVESFYNETSSSDYPELYKQIDSSLRDLDVKRVNTLLNEYEARELIPELASLVAGLELEHTPYTRHELESKIEAAKANQKWSEILELHSDLIELRDQMWELHHPLKLTPMEFERLVANIWADNGFQTTVTQATADRGLDVIATSGGQKIAIQAKRYHPDKTKVGGPETRRALGASTEEGASKCVIVTTSSFTKQAREASKRAGNGLELVNGAELIRQLNASSLSPIDAL
jgi:hypothetical protein